MADVTISQLTQSTPNGSASIPFSQNNSTNQVALSSLYNNTVQTRPIQPAFAVQADNNSYIHPANSLVRILAFTSKIFDIGNNFDTSLSRFTAPASGVYSFSGMLRTNPSPNGWLYPSFFVNGSQYGNGSLPGLSWNQNPNSSGFGTSNFHTLIRLNAGDYVDYYFGVGSTGTYQIDGQSVWYGYLLG